MFDHALLPKDSFVVNTTIRKIWSASFKSDGDPKIHIATIRDDSATDNSKTQDSAFSIEKH